MLIKMIPGHRSQRRNPLVFMDINIDGEYAGRLIIELRSDVVPKTAENFRALCTGEKGINDQGKPLHYKGVKFHRAVPQFMVQSGDIINGDGSGGESIYGPTFDDENFQLQHDAAVLSMANRGKPNTNGSQFCITTVGCPQLDGTNVVFGHVLAGLDTVYEMQEASEDGKPKVECVIDECGELCGPDADWGLRCRCDNLPEHPADLVHLPPQSVEELVSNMKTTKCSGNTYFGQGRFKGAARKYRKCLRYIDYVNGAVDALKDETLQDTLSDIIAKYKQQCYLNLAASYMKMEDYASCVKCCSEVLDTDGRNEKALYRRGQANFALKNYDAALSDLKQAERVSPSNKAVQKLLEQVRHSNKSYNEIQKQRLSKFFRDQAEKGLAVCDD